MARILLRGLYALALGVAWPFVPAAAFSSLGMLREGSGVWQYWLALGLTILCAVHGGMRSGRVAGGAPALHALTAGFLLWLLLASSPATSGSPWWAPYAIPACVLLGGLRVEFRNRRRGDGEPAPGTRRAAEADG